MRQKEGGGGASRKKSAAMKRRCASSSHEEGQGRDGQDDARAKLESEMGGRIMKESPG